MTKPLSDFNRSTSRRANAARQLARAARALTPDARGNCDAYKSSTENPRRMDDYVVCPCFSCKLHINEQPLQRRDFNRHWKECHA